jgi:hypothetical protein
MPKFCKFFSDLYSKKDIEYPKNRTVNRATAEVFNVRNGKILHDEITKAVNSLKNGKAVGLDRVLNEQLKSAANNIAALTALSKIFNGCLDLGVYLWNTTLVSPLHKKGCIYNPDNYRALGQ